MLNLVIMLPILYEPTAHLRWRQSWSVPNHPILIALDQLPPVSRVVFIILSTIVE